MLEKYNGDILSAFINTTEIIDKQHEPR